MLSLAAGGREQFFLTFEGRVGIRAPNVHMRMDISIVHANLGRSLVCSFIVASLALERFLFEEDPWKRNNQFSKHIRLRFTSVKSYQPTLFRVKLHNRIVETRSWMQNRP